MKESTCIFCKIAAGEIPSKRLAAHMTEALGCDGFNLVQNNGEVAGQTVFHFHLHLIPRYQGDGNEDKICWNHLELSQEELDKIHQLLILTKLP